MIGIFCNYEKERDRPIVQKHEKLLKKIGEEERVFSLEWFEGEVTIMECCDYCFGFSPTKEECMELSELFKELAEEIEASE